jgi:hypothetical protein
VTEGGPGSKARLLGAVLASLIVSSIVIATGARPSARLEALTNWAWLLTALQVLALWAAGTRRWWGWLLGAAVQPPWIAYAVVTAQLGFIPGCAISAVVQARSFLAGRDPRNPARPHGPAGHALRMKEAWL